MAFKPTEEQAAIVAAARDTTANLMVSALAGAAKTSTLVLMAEAMQGQDILCLAFNKKIQTEMSERLPEWCTALTLNSFGHRAWGSFLRKRITIDARKTYNLIRKWLDEELDDSELAADFWENSFDNVRDSIAAAKTAGYIPEATIKSLAVPFSSLMTDEEFEDWLDFEPTEEEAACILWVLDQSIRLGISGLLDYDDQILLPTLCKSASFNRHPVIMIDEAQDLSALNHQMLWKMSSQGKSRVIAVGDPCQAIYGFRGAHENSMRLLAERFRPMTELTLTISFRCPIAVVQEARWRAPTMRWPEWAVTGEIKKLATWTEKDIPEQATIICRNNAPLFSLAIALLRNGRYPEIWGNDLSKYFIKILKSLGGPTMDIDSANVALALWVEREKAKTKNEDKVDDKAECLRVFLAAPNETLADAIRQVENIFNRTGPIKLMTGHKSKGLEFPHVFILDEYRINKRDPQDKNLLYVMQTRAQETLTYVKSEDFMNNVEAEAPAS